MGPTKNYMPNKLNIEMKNGDVMLGMFKIIDTRCDMDRLVFWYPEEQCICAVNWVDVSKVYFYYEDENG